MMPQNFTPQNGQIQCNISKSPYKHWVTFACFPYVKEVFMIFFIYIVTIFKKLRVIPMQVRLKQ